MNKIVAVFRGKVSENKLQIEEKCGIEPLLVTGLGHETI